MGPGYSVFTHAWWILSIAVRVGGKPVSSRSYSYLTEAASSFFHGGVIECSSRMRGNFQVRFLEGWAAARPPGHSTTCVLSELKKQILEISPGTLRSLC